MVATGHRVSGVMPAAAGALEVNLEDMVLSRAAAAAGSMAAEKEGGAETAPERQAGVAMAR